MAISHIARILVEAKCRKKSEQFTEELFCFLKEINDPAIACFHIAFPLKNLSVIEFKDLCIVLSRLQCREKFQVNRIFHKYGRRCVGALDESKEC